MEIFYLFGIIGLAASIAFGVKWLITYVYQAY